MQCLVHTTFSLLLTLAIKQKNVYLKWYYLAFFVCARGDKTKIKSPTCVCVCYACFNFQLDTYVTHEGQGRMSDVLFYNFTLFLWGRVLASKPCPHSTAVIGHCFVFYVGIGDLNSDPYAYTASPLTCWAISSVPSPTCFVGNLL